MYYSLILKKNKISPTFPWPVATLCVGIVRLVQVIKYYDTEPHEWASAWQNLQEDLCDQQRLRSACAFAQSDDRSVFADHMCLLQPPGNPKMINENPCYTEWMYWSKTDLSLCTLHRSYCRFCCALAHIPYFSWRYIVQPFPLTLKMPRKPASENVYLCRLLYLLANFPNILFAYRQTVWTQIRLLLEEQFDLGPHCLQQWFLM